LLFLCCLEPLGQIAQTIVKGRFHGGVYAPPTAFRAAAAIRSALGR
jgi:hypothetical protein